MYHDSSPSPANPTRARSPCMRFFLLFMSVMAFTGCGSDDPLSTNGPNTPITSDNVTDAFFLAFSDMISGERTPLDTTTADGIEIAVYLDVPESITTESLPPDTMTGAYSGTAILTDGQVTLVDGDTAGIHWKIPVVYDDYSDDGTIVMNGTVTHRIDIVYKTVYETGCRILTETETQNIAGSVTCEGEYSGTIAMNLYATCPGVGTRWTGTLDPGDGPVSLDTHIIDVLGDVIVGTVTEGSLNQKTEGVYRLHVTQDTCLVVFARAMSGGFVPVVTVADTTGQAVQYNPGPIQMDAMTKESPLRIHVLPAGDYLVSIRDENRDGVGNFQLEVHPLPALEPTPLETDTPVNGYLDDELMTVYEFTIPEEQYVRLSLKPTSGDLAPAIVLTEADGTPLLMDDDGGSELNPDDSNRCVYADIPAGRYLVAVVRFKGSGGYQVCRNCLAGD